MKLTIDRATWRCGGTDHQNPLSEDERTQRGKGPTALCNAHGHKCCLGFYSVACGVPPEDLADNATPEQLINWHVRNRKKQLPMVCLSKLVVTRPGNDLDYETLYGNSSYASAAMTINDNPEISDEEREKSLITIAEQNGDEWRFEGEYPDK